MKTSAVHVIDLTKIEGEGEFPCPNCGTLISPDDETGNTYSILETRVNKNSLEEIVILCKCGSKIRLVGFLAAVVQR